MINACMIFYFVGIVLVLRIAHSLGSVFVHIYVGERKMKVKDSIDVVLGFKGFYFGFSNELLDIDGHG